MAEELRFVVLAAQREGQRRLAHALAALDVTPTHHVTAGPDVAAVLALLRAFVADRSTGRPAMRCSASVS